MEKWRQAQVDLCMNLQMTTDQPNLKFGYKVFYLLFPTLVRVIHVYGDLKGIEKLIVLNFMIYPTISEMNIFRALHEFG